MRTSDIPNIASFLARVWFQMASREALAGIYRKYTVITRPARIESGKRIHTHPIITAEPESYGTGWDHCTAVNSSMSERQASACIEQALNRANIL